MVSDRSFALRDAAHFYYPLFEWCCREWSAGRVPLWNPDSFCGAPIYANWQLAPFDAASLVSYALPARQGILLRSIQKSRADLCNEIDQIIESD